uniref:Uncharacterized protein n=1 Tax=Arundo donax TaxID=35708 RepID=A0A0A9GMH1_ARUDO
MSSLSNGFTELQIKSCLCLFCLQVRRSPTLLL